MLKVTKPAQEINLLMCNINCSRKLKKNEELLKKRKIDMMQLLWKYQIT